MWARLEDAEVKLLLEILVAEAMIASDKKYLLDHSIGKWISANSVEILRRAYPKQVKETDDTNEQAQIDNPTASKERA